MNTRLVIIFVFFKLLILTSVDGQQQEVTSKFSVIQNCDYLVEFSNESTSVNESDTIYFLWRFYGLNTMAIESPVENPVMAYPHPGKFDVSLLAWTPEGYSDQFDTIIYVKQSSFLTEIFSDDFLVCSNTSLTTYSIVIEAPDSLTFSYFWYLSDMSYVQNIAGEATPEVIISWNQINTSPSTPVHLEIICEVTSSEGCMSKKSEQILLIPESVPTDQVYSLIRKPSDKQPSNILLCLINESHLYSYRWGYSGLNESWDTITSKPYFYFDEIDNSKTYWVEILNPDYSFCSVIAYLEPESKEISISSRLNNTVEIYPNPGKDYIYIKFTESSVTNAQVSIYNISGQLIWNEVLPFAESNQSIKFKTDYLKSGVYFLKIQQSNQFIHTSKIIIND